MQLTKVLMLSESASFSSASHPRQDSEETEERALWPVNALCSTFALLQLGRASRQSRQTSGLRRCLRWKMLTLVIAASSIIAFFWVSLSPSLLRAVSALSLSFCVFSGEGLTWAEPCRALNGTIRRGWFTRG